MKVPSGRRLKKTAANCCWRCWWWWAGSVSVRHFRATVVAGRAYVVLMLMYFIVLKVDLILQHVVIYTLSPKFAHTL